MTEPRLSDTLATIEARLDQLVTVVQGRLMDRLDQLTAALDRVQARLTVLEEHLAAFRAELVDDEVAATVEPEAP